MKERLIAFDVETPNCLNNRISAIGVSIVEDGEIIREFYTPVDPEARFDRFNMELTGITPEAVAGAPTFPELWLSLGPLLDSGLPAAHNAPFDMSVLGKCLRDYGILWRPAVRYVCTCQMARRLLPELENHRLNTLCDWYGIPLDHHHAGSDSRACAELLIHYLKGGADIGAFTRTYDLLRLGTVSGRRR